VHTGTTSWPSTICPVAGAAAARSSTGVDAIAVIAKKEVMAIATKLKRILDEEISMVVI
jgi:hypothetical protein